MHGPTSPSSSHAIRHYLNCVDLQLPYLLLQAFNMSSQQPVSEFIWMHKTQNQKPKWNEIDNLQNEPVTFYDFSWLFRLSVYLFVICLSVCPFVIKYLSVCPSVIKYLPVCQSGSVCLLSEIVWLVYACPFVFYICVFGRIKLCLSFLSLPLCSLQF